MNEPSKNKLLSLLVEIQSDIRQIKSDHFRMSLK
jgi:hypothetical protein